MESQAVNSFPSVARAAVSSLASIGLAEQTGQIGIFRSDFEDRVRMGGSFFRILAPRRYICATSCARDACLDIDSRQGVTLSFRNRSRLGGEVSSPEKDDSTRVNRSLRMMKECVQALVRATEETELLREICRIIVDAGGYVMSWVRYADSDTARHVTPVAQSGYEAGYVRELHVSWADDEHGRGPTGRAIRTGQAAIARDIMTDQDFEPWRTEAVARGYRSSIALPLRADGKTLGALNIYAKEANAFQSEELELLQQLADDLAYGIVALRARIEQRSIEERLRRSEELFRLISENVSDLIAIVDEDGRRIYNSPSYGGVLGKPDDLKGTFSLSEIHPDDRERIAQVFRDSLRTGVGQRTEYRFLLKDGSVRYIESQGNVIKDGGGSTRRLLIVSRDVTERRRAEEQRSILQEQLRQAQKLESIGTLAGGIAHDFNNILSIVLATTSLLGKKRANAPEHAKLVNLINDTVQRGANLARQLLTFARKSEAAFEPLNINDTIEELVRMLKATFPKSITFSLETSRNIPYVIADKSQIHQALLNLCVNARDAMPKGGTLTVGTGIVSGEELHARFGSTADDSYLHIRLSDTGTGMDETTRARIFEPFFTTKQDGTGLGLAVVYGVVKSHRGFIDLDTQPGAGTRFNLYLPVSTHAVRTGVEPAALIEAPPRGAGETVLFVEDESAISDVVRTILEENGYSVLTASDGMEAVELYRGRWRDIAVVMTDVGLPRLNGLDAFLRIKEINPAAKVIFATGYLDPALRSQIMHLGARGFLQKPYVSGEILKILRRVIQSVRP